MDYIENQIIPRETFTPKNDDLKNIVEEAILTHDTAKFKQLMLGGQKTRLEINNIIVQMYTKKLDDGVDIIESLYVLKHASFHTVDTVTICSKVIINLYMNDKLYLLAETIDPSAGNKTRYLIREILRGYDTVAQMIIIAQQSKGLDVKSFTNKLLDLILLHPDIVSPKYVIQNFLQCFQDDMVNVIDKLLSSNYLLNSDIYAIFYKITNMDHLESITGKLLNDGIIPSHDFVVELIVGDRLDILEIFYKHNLDIMQILSKIKEFRPSQRYANKMKFFNKIGFTLEDYCELHDYVTFDM